MMAAPTRTDPETAPADHAVVVGAGVAGLMVTAVLAERFDRVTVVDRDHPGADTGARTGVPQGRHGHILLPAGLRVASDLLPGLVDDLRAADAHLFHAGQLRFWIEGGRLALHDRTPTFVGATRPHLEAVLRARVRAHPRVRWVDGHQVIGLATGRDRSRVTGVRIRGVDGDRVQLWPAQVVVDASGRGSRAPAWLAELGGPKPAEQRMQLNVRYTTRLFRRTPEDLDGCQHVVVSIPRTGRRGGFAVAVEDDRWLVSLVGMLGQKAPAQLDGFVDFAGSLWAPDLHDIVAGAQPAGPPSTGSFAAAVRRRYDRLRRMPEGVVVVGDAACAFNPAYAQGMTIAIREAALLGQILDRHGVARLGSRFFRQGRRIIDPAWQLATSADLGHPAVQGPRPPTWRLLDGYLSRLLTVAHRDPVVADAFLQVMGMLAPPPRLLHPRILGRVFGSARAAAAVPSAAPGGRPSDHVDPARST